MSICACGACARAHTPAPSRTEVHAHRLDTSQIMDGSRKGADGHFEASMYLSADTVYELALAYSLTPETRRGLVLEWQSAASSRSAVTSSSLLLGEPVAGSPFAVVVVRPAPSPTSRASASAAQRGATRFADRCRQTRARPCRPSRTARR